MSVVNTTRYGRALRVAAAALIAMNLVVALLAFTPILRGPIRRSVRSDALPAHPADAIVVLGGYVSADRLLEGIRLVKERRAALLLTSPHGVSGGDLDSADARKLMAMAGVESSWRSFGEAHTTRDEAEDILRVREGYGLHSIIVVTSPMHTRRACGAIEKLTRLVVSCVAAKERWPATLDPRDVSNRIEAARQYFYERLATIKYKYNGWL